MLLDGYSKADFDADLALLKGAYAVLGEGEQAAKIERDERDTQQKTAKAAMVEYRAAVKGTFAPKHPLVTSLPAVSPRPGNNTVPVPATTAEGAE